MVVYIKLGENEYKLGEYYNARTFFKEALSVATNLIKLDPDDTSFHWELLVIYKNLGDAHLKSKNLTKAKFPYKKALEVARKLVTMDPENIKFRRELVFSNARLGDLLKHSDVSEAVKHYKYSMNLIRTMKKAGLLDADIEENIGALRKAIR